MKIDIPASTKTVILNIVSNEMIELKNKVEEAKQVLGLKKNWNLSEAMGHQGRYIDRVLRDGVSTNKQKEIIKTLNMMIDLHKAYAECEKEIDGHFVSGAYHEQEVAILSNRIKESIQVRDCLQKELIEIEKISDARWDDLQEEKSNVRMLNGEVVELEGKVKLWKGLAWLAFVIAGCLVVALGVVVK